jgi:putative pyrroloquinoline-quinone binding quinoprotein
MGLLAALDATAKGPISKEQVKWLLRGFQGGFSSPVIDGDRLYQVDNGANLFAFDTNTGKQLWMLSLGTVQKSSLVLGDGKLYVGTESGKFFILKPGPDKCEILDEDEMEPTPEGSPQAIVASVAISAGRIYLVTDSNIYCIGKKTAGQAVAASPAALPPPGAASHVQVVPADVELKPGQSVKFRVRLFDDHGIFVREAEKATWSIDQLTGLILPDGTFTAAAGGIPEAGTLKATVGQISGSARLRVFPPLPWSENFDSLAVDSVPRYWNNFDGKYAVREVDQNKVLLKKPEPPIFKRGRAFIGPSSMSNYTVEADLRATEKRRQMGDGGVVAQRYCLVLFGNHQRIELESWQPETERTVRAPFSWKADTWYRLKLEVQNLPDGKRVRARGKAWPAAESEPAAWTIERIDPIGNRQGSPGLYADAIFDVFFDNVKVTGNK